MVAVLSAKPLEARVALLVSVMKWFVIMVVFDVLHMVMRKRHWHWDGFFHGVRYLLEWLDKLLFAFNHSTNLKLYNYMILYD